ncbi:MAG: DUF2905 domain-containing protein [Armatimonadetes bacterium]|nr:DUF2905 domain-containing protein [Armatimonadota bacterium]
MDNLGRTLVIMGLGLVALGAAVWLLQASTGLKLGRLPGDLWVHREGFSFFFPMTTMLLISAVLTLVFWLAAHFRR